MAHAAQAEPIRKGYADSSGGQIHYRVIEGEGLATVFLHQTASSGKMWEKVMHSMAGFGSLYALDTPGFGGSFDPPKDAEPSMTDYGRWLSEAIADLGVERCALVGHHTGACISLELVELMPNLVECMALIGPVPLTAEERLEFSKHFGTPFTPAASGAYLLENWDYLRQLGAHADPMLIHREMADQLRAWWGRVQSYKAVWEQDFYAKYERLSLSLMIGAAPDDVLFNYLARAKELQPSATVVELKGANFEPDLDSHNLAAALARFIYPGA